MSYFGTSSLDVSEKVDLVFSVSKINSSERVTALLSLPIPLFSGIMTQ
jgi:hypothetical protein